MQKHTKIYLDAFGLDISDFIPCEVCGQKSDATHHIEARKMGGRPNNDMDRIENLMAICGRHDKMYGDKKEYKTMLFQYHKSKMQSERVKFDETWINEMIIKHDKHTN